jgi:hypothetical protein
MELIKEWWALIVAAITTIFWFSRLEWRGLQNESEINRLWKQRKEDLDSAQRARDETNEILKEMRGDIKELLKKGASQ